MRRRRKYRRLIAAALAAGLLAAPPASARPADESARTARPLPTTGPLPAPGDDGPQTWLVLVGLAGAAVVAGGTAGVHPRRLTRS